MSTHIKAILVLVVSVLLFIGVTYIIDVEPLDYIRTYFYNPSIVNSVIRENHKDAQIVQNHISELTDRFSSVLNEPSVRNSFLHTQSAEDIYERSRYFGILLETVNGLQMAQFVDSNGIRIHFSTSIRDIISQSGASTSFRNYTEDARAMPFDLVSVAENGEPKFTMDDSHDRIIFSFPFYDSMDIYRGTALFTLSVRSLAERLIAEGRLMPSDEISVIRIPPGVVFGSPDTSRAVIMERVSAIWSEGLQDHVTLDSEDSGVHFALISTKTEQNLFFGRLVNNAVFSIPESMKFVLNISMFLTFFLALFFLLNFKPSPAVLVRIRLEKLRANLFQQLYINKSSQDRSRWILELEQRRDGIRLELKNRLRIRRGQEEKIDDMIDKAWDELLDVIKSGSGLVQIVKQQAKAPLADDVEEIGEIEEIDEVEALEDVEEIDEVEALEDVEEIDEVEALEDVEEIDEVEALEDVEEIDEVEALEDVEAEALEVEDLEEVNLEEAEELEDIGEIEEIEDEEMETFNILVEALSVKELEVEELEAADAPQVGLLALASRKKTAPKERKGLLALASKEEYHSAPLIKSAKGLLALAREIEFSKDYPVLDEGGAELAAEVDIVSPFDTMFYDLDESISSMASD